MISANPHACPKCRPHARAYHCEDPASLAEVTARLKARLDAHARAQGEEPAEERVRRAHERGLTALRNLATCDAKHMPERQGACLLAGLEILQAEEELARKDPARK
jgi:hypothetical protein